MEQLRAPSPLADILLSGLEANNSFVLGKERRCSGLLIRATFNVIHCDEILRTVPLRKTHSSDHVVIGTALRKHGGRLTTKLENNPNWQLWAISCDISDAQHRIAATLERCVNRWLLMLGQNSELSEDQKRKEAHHFENSTSQWVGSRLTILRFLINFISDFLSRNHKADLASQTFVKQCEQANALISDILEALAPFVDTADAARAIGDVQRKLFGECVQADLDYCLSAADIMSMMKSDGKPLSTVHCLAITIGRVNDFKHRATNPIDPATFMDLKGYGHRHVELAIAVQALQAAIRFFNEMTNFLKNAPKHVVLGANN